MATSRNNVDRARRAVIAALPRTAKVKPGGQSGSLAIGSQELRLAWIGEGNLRDARALIESRGGRPHVAAARRMSPGARAALAEARIGWVDESGAAEFAVGSIVVSRSAPPAEQEKKPAKWTPSVFAVAEALLCGARATVAATVEATGLSTGSCTKALQALTELGLLVAKADRGPGSARSIEKPDEFLDAYATAADARGRGPGVPVGVAWKDPMKGLKELGRAWKRERIDWAVTGTAAGSILAPYLTTVTSTEVYVGASSISEIESAARAAGLRAIEGGRLTLRPFPTVTTGHLAELHRGLWIAPWPRVFVDLRRSGVRGEEAAEHLREVAHAR